MFRKKQIDRALYPIIIYGPPRSGTTYLGNILNQHPDIFISNEYRVFTWLHQASHVLPEIDDMVLHERKAFRKYLDENLPALIKNFYEKMHPNVKYWGDKNPFYGGDTGRLRTIAEYFPGTKFINIVRDGRDVATSLMNKKWPDGRPWSDFDDAHHVWNSHVEVCLEFSEEVNKKNFYFIKYEDLIQNDLSEAEKIFKFLNIDFHPNVIKYCKQQEKERTMVSGPVRKIGKDASISMWAQTLDKKQQAESLRILKPNMKKLGYKI